PTPQGWAQATGNGTGPGRECHRTSPIALQVLEKGLYIPAKLGGLFGAGPLFRTGAGRLPVGGFPAAPANGLIRRTALSNTYPTGAPAALHLRRLRSGPAEKRGQHE